VYSSVHATTVDGLRPPIAKAAFWVPAAPKSCLAVAIALLIDQVAPSYSSVQDKKDYYNPSKTTPALWVPAPANSYFAI
jgi:hypothetical protein